MLYYCIFSTDGPCSQHELRYNFMSMGRTINGTLLHRIVMVMHLFLQLLLLNHNIDQRHCIITKLLLLEFTMSMGKVPDSKYS